MSSAHLKSLFDWLLVGVFVVVITVPGLVLVLGSQGDVSEREKRRLASLPVPTTGMVLTGLFQKSFEGWVQDHLGLRDAILQGARHYRETLFSKSISDNVIVGEDGWRYFDVDGALYDQVGTMHRGLEKVDGWLESLANKSRWLDQLGVHYLLVPIPGKMTLYPEHLPNRIQSLSGETRLEAFRSRFNALPSDDPMRHHVVDAKAVLEQAKRSGPEIDGPLYFRSDTHWTDIGAYEVYAATLEQARRWLSDLYIAPPARFETIEKLKDGDISRAAGMPSDWRERSIALSNKAPCASTNYRRVEAFVATDAYRKRPKRLPVVNGCEERRYKALVVHDSFGQFLKQFLNESFAEVVYMPSYDVAGMRSFIEAFQPDLFIDFRVERRFHLLLGPDAELAKASQPD